MKFMYSFVRKFGLASALFLLPICSLSANAYRFAFLSDVHVVPGNKNDSALRVAVKEINSGVFDAVVMAGDLSNEGSDVQIDNVSSILGKINKPLYIIPGNHENNWSQSATKHFIDVFGNDRFVFRIDSLLVVGMNCGPYMKMGDGHIKQEDLHWLRNVLEHNVKPGDKVLSINHYPIRDNDIDNYLDYASVLSDFPVMGHINGHYHRWINYEIGDMPAVMIRALDMGKGNYGYTIININEDWVQVYDKELGKHPVPKFAFATATSHPGLNKFVSANQQKTLMHPRGFRIDKVWADSASVFTRLAIDKDNIYFGTSNGKIKAVERTGKCKWIIDAPDSASIFSRPTVLTETNVAFPYSSGLLILDKYTGKIKKEYKTPGSPYVADGICDGKHYYQGGFKKFECRMPKTGKIIWSYDSIKNYCQASPVLAGDKIVFGAWDTNLRVLDRKTGGLIWKWNNSRPANMLSPGNVVPVVTEGKVIIVAPDRYMTALDLETGKMIWRDNAHKYRESLGVSEDGKTVYAKTMDGELVAVSAEGDKFNELWVTDLGIGYEHAPCIVIENNGIVYCGTRKGVVTAVDAETHNLLWKEQLGNSEVNGFDKDPLSDDIYLSLIEGTVFRISRNK